MFRTTCQLSGCFCSGMLSLAIALFLHVLKNRVWLLGPGLTFENRVFVNICVYRWAQCCFIFSVDVIDVHSSLTTMLLWSFRVRYISCFVPLCIADVQAKKWMYMMHLYHLHISYILTIIGKTLWLRVWKMWFCVYKIDTVVCAVVTCKLLTYFIACSLYGRTWSTAVTALLRPAFTAPMTSLVYMNCGIFGSRAVVCRRNIVIGHLTEG